MSFSDVAAPALHRELRLGTLTGVLKQAGLTAQEFIDALDE